MNLVRGDDIVFRIMYFPPKTVTDDSDLEGIACVLGVLDLTHRARGSKRQDNHYQDWRYSPRKLDRGAAVHLWRLGRIVVGRSLAVTHDGVKQQSTDNDKDAQTNQQHQYISPMHSLCRSAYRPENALEGTNLIGSLRACRTR